MIQENPPWINDQANKTVPTRLSGIVRYIHPDNWRTLSPQIRIEGPNNRDSTRGMMRASRRFR